MNAETLVYYFPILLTDYCTESAKSKAFERSVNHAEQIRGLNNTETPTKIKQDPRKRG